MNIKGAFSIIEKYGLSALETKKLDSTVLNEPPYNAKKRYQIKLQIIREKRSEFERQLSIALEQLGKDRLSDCTDPEIIDLRKSIDELSLAEKIIEQEQEKDFWLR